MSAAAAAALDRLVGARQGHFELESGHHGELWLELDALFARPNRLAPLVSSLADLLRPHRVEVVCGPVTGGAFLAQLTAAELGCEFAYTERKGAPAGGQLFQARYRLPRGLVPRLDGRRVAIVDDVLSAGSATRATLLELRAHRARTPVAGALLVLGDGGAEYLAGEGVALVALARRQARIWRPGECPHCRAGVPLQNVAGS